MATGNLGEVGGDLHCLSLHEMFRVIGDQLTIRDVQMLKFLYGGIMSDDMWHKIDSGFSFLLALEKMKRVDETSFKHLLHLLRIISRHDLSRCVTRRKRKTVERDPVDEYLESTARFPTKRRRGKATYSIISDPNPTPPTGSSPPSTHPSPSGQPPLPPSTSPAPSSSRENLPSASSSSACPVSSSSSPSTSHSDSSPQGPESAPQGVAPAPTPTARRRRTRGFTGRRRKARRKTERRRTAEEEDAGVRVGERSIPASGETIRKKVTCDIRLRVRAEYVQHVSALEGNVFSHKAELVERQFEKFSQANTILKSRDLGSIICDIKFSELTYLDAFWRDYINGSLLEALKGVFITESLKQAVGHEAIKLLVNVDEDDYEAGRLKLLENLKD